MGSAVVGVKIVIIAMLLLTTSFTGHLVSRASRIFPRTRMRIRGKIRLARETTGHSHRQRYQHASNHQASTVQMKSVQMASLWAPGKVESFWCGMRHALTPLHHCTHQGPPMSQGLWLLKRSYPSSSDGAELILRGGVHCIVTIIVYSILILICIYTFYMMTESKIKETRYSITSRIQRNRL